MLTINHLTKHYKGSSKGVTDLSLHVAPGDLYAFIGHNGAGKTTTLKAITGIHDFDKGEIFINGIDLKADPLACKRAFAYIPDNPDLYEYLTGIQYLNFIADVFEVSAQERNKRIAKYADAYERAYYNAYLGSVNTEHRHSTHEFPKGVVPKPMPFDSYSPLTADVRGKAVGGFRVLDGHSFYGCCVCIAAAGIGSVPKMALASFDKGLVMNLYIDGEISTLSPGGNPVRLITKTAYPADGTVSITVENASNEHFTLRLRIPDWCDSLTLTQNGKAIEAGKGYVDTEISDKIEYVELCFDMPTRVIRPIPYGEQVLMNKVIWGNRSMVVPTYDKEDEDAKNHVALRRGPLMLAQDSRFGYSLKEPARFVFENECAEVKAASADFDTLLTLDVKTESGFIRLCDYQSAGKLYSDESICAVWMKNN